MRSILADAPPGAAPAILVVCNGCTDDTAAVARSAAPAATVIELETGSKSLALNTGLAMAPAAPILFMDADVKADYRSLAAVADVLREPGVAAASPAANLVTKGSGLLVRAYYRVWRRHPYLQSGVGGSGVVGLSADAAARLGRFPTVIADDTMIRTLFPLDEQRRVAADAAGRPVASEVLAPKTVRHLLACESRWRAGDEELKRLGLVQHGGPEIGRASLPQLWKSSGSPLDFIIYVGIKMAGRALSVRHRWKGRGRVWHRDESRRAAAEGSQV